MDAVVSQLNSMGRSFVTFALPMLIQSSLFMLVLLGLNLLLRRKTRAVFRYWLLLLILIKLVLPTTLSAPTGIGYGVGGNFLISKLNLPAPNPMISNQPVLGGGRRLIVFPLPLLTILQLHSCRALIRRQPPHCPSRCRPPCRLNLPQS